MEALSAYLKPELIWFLVGLVLLMAEFTAPGLVIFFFGVGAWVTALVCFLAPIGLNTQLILFLVVSVVSLLALRKWLKGIFYGHIKGQQELTQELSEFIGERALVTEKISPHEPGKVELHGTEWSASADQDIAEGTAVQVIANNNLMLTVKPY